MARVTTPKGRTSVGQSLNWFYRKAQKASIRSIVLTHVEHSYVMEVVFDDNEIFVSAFKSLASFKRTVGSRKALRGEEVCVVDKNKAHAITIGEK